MLKGGKHESSNQVNSPRRTSHFIQPSSRGGQHSGGEANPKNWPSAEMKLMMREHLDLTTAEAQARLKGDWAADTAAYEKVHGQIPHMADMLSAGIVSQLPQKFK